MSASFLPYPGGKAKLSPHIIAEMNKHTFNEYREPLLGGGAIALFYATESHARCWINDKDIGIYSLWESVVNHHLDLISKIREFKPSLEQFYYLKEFFRNVPTDDVVEIGFNKLAIHKLSFGGLGERGNVVGGQHQSKFQVDHRWSPDYIIKKIEYVHDCFRWRQPKVTRLDYSEVIEATSSNNGPGRVMLYLDPPYYSQGPAVYRHSFMDPDHVRLSELLRQTEYKWVLSYDDHTRIRDLYDWAEIQTLDVTYSVARAGTRKKELLITPRRHTVH